MHPTCTPSNLGLIDSKGAERKVSGSESIGALAWQHGSHAVKLVKPFDGPALCALPRKSSPMMWSTGEPSPTPTSPGFSGISTYRTDTYKPLGDKSFDSTPPIDSYQVARTQFDELSRYLSLYLAKGYISLYLRRFAPTHVHSTAEPANSRSTARQKLTRLTRQQFSELSTDVYDELVRRKTNTVNPSPSLFSLLSVAIHLTGRSTVVPFLPVRDEFHPKRNQARQKLATLPSSRFQDLSSDVYYELIRRYPEFKEEVRLILPPLIDLFLAPFPHSLLM